MRDLTPSMATELSGENMLPVVLAQMNFDSGTLYMWNGVGELVWNGNTFIGGGALITVSPMEETQNLEAKGIVCTLNGVPTSLIALSLAERTRGRGFRMWLGALDTSVQSGTLVQEDGFYLLQEDDGKILMDGGVVIPNSVILNPMRYFTGLMDVMEVSDDGQNAAIRLAVESSQIIGQRNKLARYTAEEQKKKYPGDVGLDLINQLQDKEVVW